MKWLLPAGMLLLLIPVAVAETPGVLTLTEISPDGKRLSVPDDTTRYGIIDINSSLDISIDTSALRAIAGQHVGARTGVEPARLDALRKVLEGESVILGAFGDCAYTPDSCRQLLSTVSMQLLELMNFLSEDPELNAKANEILGRERAPEDQTGAYKELLTLAATELRQIAVTVDPQATGVSFGMRAWLKDTKGGERKVHLDGFDSYSDGQFYEKPVVVMPDPEQIAAELEGLGNAARVYNERGIIGALGIADWLASLANSLDAFVLCGQTALSRLTAGPSVAELLGAQPQLQQAITEFTENLRLLQEQTSRLRNAATFVENSSDPLLATVQLQAEAMELIEKVPSWIEAQQTRASDIMTAVRGIRADSAVTAAMNTAVRQLEPCLESFGAIRQTVATARQLFDWFCPEQHHELALAGKFFNDKVEKYRINELPSKTQLDLRYTGRRDNGDALVVRVAMELPATDLGAEPREKVLETRTLLLYQIDYHIALSTGLVFVHPFCGDPDSLERTFQAAASYSMVLHWGSRSSIKWNSLWYPGIGINVSAPDLNENSNPELGLALVGTLVRDVFQVGVGRTVLGDLESNYWFFSIQLPWDLIGGPAGKGRP